MAVSCQKYAGIDMRVPVVACDGIGAFGEIVNRKHGVVNSGAIIK